MFGWVFLAFMGALGAGGCIASGATTDAAVLGGLSILCLACASGEAR